MSNSPEALLAQSSGAAPNGTVTLRSFDQGIVETLGGRVIGDKYYVTIEGIDPPPGEPGIPIHFAFPEDYFANFRYPAFVVTRDDISISFQRIHPFQQQFRAAPKSAIPVVVQTPRGPISGYDRMSQRQDATPYDITYSINAFNSLRGGFGGKRAANMMLDHILRIFPVYSQVFVRDSLGAIRTYEAFNEGISSFDDLMGVSERMIQFTVTVRVEAEYDLSDETTSRTVTQVDVSLTRK